MSRLYAAAAVGFVIALVGGSAAYVTLSRASDPFAECRSGQIGGGDIGGPFTLVDGTGKTVTDKDVITAPTLVYFGYTFCPDVCPLDMSRNADVADILEEKGFEINLAFISIDPARDTPDVVAQFAANHHPRAIGLTGSEDQVSAAAKAYRAYYKKNDTGDENYLMDHSAFTYLMLPGSGFADFYKHDALAEPVADGVACFLEHAKPQN